MALTWLVPFVFLGQNFASDWILYSAIKVVSSLQKRIKFGWDESGIKNS